MNSQVRLVVHAKNILKYILIGFVIRMVGERLALIDYYFQIFRVFCVFTHRVNHRAFSFVAGIS